MPPKRFKRGGKSSSYPRSIISSSRSLNLPVFMGTCRILMRTQNFQVVMATDNKPIFSVAASTSSDSYALQPVTLSGRLSQLAECFQQYRVNRITFHYRPTASFSGVAETASPTTTPTYISNQLALGFSADPASTAVNFENLLELGGVATACSSPVSLTFTPKVGKWLYTQMPTTPSLADLRQCAFGRLNGFFQITPGANVTNPIGSIILDIDVSFRFPMDNSLPAASLQDEEKSLNESPVYVENTVTKSTDRKSSQPTALGAGVPKQVKGLWKPPEMS